MNDNNQKPEVDRIELEEPDVLTIFQIIKNTVIKLKDRTAIILWSSFILLTLWGFKGDTKLLFDIFGKDWLKSLFPGIPWREQFFSFLSGFILLVVIPCLIIKFGFKEKLSKYGLGFPKKEHRKLAVLAFFVILVIVAPLFYVGTFDPSMAEEYPLFRDTITTWGAFIIYELIYFIFFINIEFIFRGYLLFGLFGIEDIKTLRSARGVRGPMVFGLYAILIQMLAYTMWHIGKPVPEYMGALVWGVVVAAVALKIRSIWPIILVHWLLNVFSDTILWLR